MHVWIPDIPILEKILRSLAVYVFLLIAFRLIGKRQVAQMTPFDLIVLLMISNVLQNAMIGPDNSIFGGIVGVVTIFVMNGVVARLTFASRRCERLIDGQPTRLVHDGHVDEAAMARELVTRAELHAALREAGLAEVSEARFVMLEATGRITVGPQR